jgi:hypothetical protein
MSAVIVRPVESKSDMNAFLRMPWTVYKDDPLWAPPLWNEHKHYFDAAHNAELEHIDQQLFVAWRDDTPVGTVIAFINHAYNDFQKQNAGWFGQFELLNDPEAADALLETAETWVKAKGVDKVMGPATYSTNSEVGLMIDGWEYGHSILMSYSRPYYQGFVEKRGYVKAMDLLCWSVSTSDFGEIDAHGNPARYARLVEKIKARRDFTVRKPRMNRLDEEIEHIQRIYNSAWEANWGFVPMSDKEINQLKDQIVSILDTRIAVVVEKDGIPVGFALPIPDIYQALAKAKPRAGEPAILSLPRLLWHWKIAGSITSMRAWALGVLEEHRRSGLDVVLIYEISRNGIPAGYNHAEMSWILENNDMMNRAIESLGSTISKRYRVYEKAVS